MTTIVAYAFEAAMHCPGCTKERAQGLRLDHAHPHAVGETCKDSHGIENDLVDREGNLIHPVFSTDEISPTDSCDDCRATLRGTP